MLSTRRKLAVRCGRRSIERRRECCPSNNSGHSGVRTNSIYHVCNPTPCSGNESLVLRLGWFAVGELATGERRSRPGSAHWKPGEPPPSGTSGYRRRACDIRTFLDASEAHNVPLTLGRLYDPSLPGDRNQPFSRQREAFVVADVGFTPGLKTGILSSLYSASDFVWVPRGDTRSARAPSHSGFEGELNRSSVRRD